MQTGTVQAVGTSDPPSLVKAAEKTKRKPAAVAWATAISDTAAISGDATRSEPAIQADETPRQKTAVDVETFVTAIRAFVDAYNGWIADCADATDMRAALYRPVALPHACAATSPISLYEIGVSHTADYTKKHCLTVRESVLRAALAKRGGDVAILFTKTGDGLLDRLHAIVGDDDGADPPLEAFMAQCTHCASVLGASGDVQQTDTPNKKSP